MPATDLSPLRCVRRAPAAPFDEVFGVRAADVLASMDAAGDDVVNQPPGCGIEIGAVGLRRRDVVVAIRDPFGSPADVSAVCTLDVAAGVPRDRRGIHLSRIGQIVAESTSASYPDVASYAEALARAVAESQYGRARVGVRARIPYLEEVQADPSGRRRLSLEHLDVLAKQTLDDGRATHDAGIRVTHLVACPCVQKTTQHARALRPGAGAAGEDAGARMPLMTHSQRCATTVIACGVTRDVPPAELLARLDRVLWRTCNTLPRDAELLCVERAHRSPQFIEDALRAAAAALAEAWSAPASFRCIAGRSRSLESIHEHDLTASLRLRPSDLR